MNIAFCFDNNYYVPARIMVESLLIHNSGENITFYSFRNNLSKSSMDGMRDLIEQYGAHLTWLEFHESTLELIRKMPIPCEHISMASYYRLLIPYVINESVDKLLYLDCDILVRDNILSGYNIDIEGYTIAGVSDLNGEAFQARLNLNGDYVNAGVLLMNIPRIREKYSLEVMLSEMSRIMFLPECKMGDQDMINILFDQEIEKLPRAYNYQKLIQKKYILKNKKELDEVKIVHFITGSKPWQGTYCFPFMREYYKYLKKYLSLRERIKYWYEKPLGLIYIFIKHSQWKKRSIKS